MTAPPPPIGSKSLSKTPSGATWSAGVAYEVAWAIAANHAGGYQYRLAPAAGPLTEAEFQKTPLEFVGEQGFRWGGGPAHGGSELFFNGTYVSTGTVLLGLGRIVALYYHSSTLYRIH